MSAMTANDSQNDFCLSIDKALEEIANIVGAPIKEDPEARDEVRTVLKSLYHAGYTDYMRSHVYSADKHN